MICKYLLLPHLLLSALYLSMPMLLLALIPVFLLQNCNDRKGFDDPEQISTAAADVQSAIAAWREFEGGDGDFTPLHDAVLSGARVEVVGTLLDQGADVNARYDNQFSRWNGWTPLHMAANRGVRLTIETLLNRGADIEARNAEGATPLHIAALYGQASAAETLLKRGADIHARAGGEEFDNYDYYLGTPLHLAARQSEGLYEECCPTILPDWYPTILENKPAVIGTLLDNGANTELEDERGFTPLHWTVEVNIDEKSPNVTTIKRRVALEVAELLIRHGAEVDAHSGEEYWTPLYAALASDAGFEIVEMLLDHGADVNIGNQTGLTPLHLAANDGFEVIKLLLERGSAPSINTCSENGFSPFSSALGGATLEIVELFMERGASVDAGCEFELLLKSCSVVGRGSNESLVFQRFPIHQAARNEDPVITRLLLELGADPNVEGVCYATPLMSSANVEVAKVLLQHGADTEARDIIGETPLLWKTRFSHLDDETERIKSFDLIETLLDYGAHVDARSNSGHNALHYLADWGGSDLELVKFFLDRGVDPNERANNGETPCHIARDSAGFDEDYPEELLELFCG